MVNAELNVSVRNPRKRLSPQAYLITKGLLTKTQMGLCALCHEPGIEEIDHVNGDPSDNHPDNLRGVHKSCNIRQRNLTLKQSAESVIVSERELEQVASAEIDISRDKEPAWRKWMFERVGKPEPLYVEEAIYGGAEFVGCNPQTTRRYLGKVVSPQGIYSLVKVRTQNRTLKQIVPK